MIRAPCWRCGRRRRCGRRGCQEGDDADGEGEMDVDMDGGQVVDEDEMMPDGDA